MYFFSFFYKTCKNIAIRKYLSTSFPFLSEGPKINEGLFLKQEKRALGHTATR